MSYPYLPRSVILFCVISRRRQKSLDVFETFEARLIKPIKNTFFQVPPLPFMEDLDSWPKAPLRDDLLRPGNPVFHFNSQ